MRFRVLNKYGNAVNLQALKSSTFFFPHQDGGDLEKKNAVVTDLSRGELEVELTDFEIQGLNLGEGQTVLAKLYFPFEKYEVKFEQALNVQQIENKKVILNEQN